MVDFDVYDFIILKEEFKLIRFIQISEYIINLKKFD